MPNLYPTLNKAARWLNLSLLIGILALFFSSSFANPQFENLTDSQKQELTKQIIQYLEQNPELSDGFMEKSINRYINKQREQARLNEEEREKLEVEQAKVLLTTLKATDHIKGDANAPFLLIDYSDFQCPFCQRFHVTAQNFIKANPDVALVYRHFPLPSHEPLATKQAIAAECVSQIKGPDGFWQASDLIFETNPSSESAMVSLAARLGIAENDFLNCFLNPNGLRGIGQKIKTDLDEGQIAGVRGTPGVFLINRESGEIKVIPGAVGLQYLTDVLAQMKSQ